MKRKSYLTLALTIMLLTFPAPGGRVRSATGPAQGAPPLSSRFTTNAPTIDGRFQPGEWDDATFEPFTFFMVDLATFEDTTYIPADLYLMNDHQNLYLGLQVLGVSYNNPGLAGDGYDFVFLLFDDDDDQTISLNEDQRFLTTIQPSIEGGQRGSYVDAHVVPEGEDGADPHIDGLGRIAHSEVAGLGDYTIEFTIPLDSGDAHDIRVMPDGRLRFNIVLATRLGGAAEAGALYGLNFEDSGGWGVIQLQPGQSPPDPEPTLSGTIAFVTREFADGRQVFVMNADGTEVRARTRGDRIIATPALSPDTLQTVYTAAARNGEGQEIEGSREMYIQNTSRGFARRLTNNGVSEFYPVFSPSGQEVAFLREGNIWAMNVATRAERQLTNLGADVDPLAAFGFGRGVAWTPDGRIVFTTLRWGGLPQLAIMNTDGSNVTPLTRGARPGFSPSMSPDGQWVTFYRYDGEGAFSEFDVSPFQAWNIYRIRIDGTEEQRLTNDGLFNLNPVFSPDGRGILYQKFLDVGSFYSALYYLDLQTGEDRRVLDPLISRIETFDWR